MNTRLFIALSLLGLYCQFIWGQNGTTERNTFSIQDLSIQGGIFSGRNAVASLEDFKKLAPQSAILAKDYSQFTTYFGSYTSSSSFLSVQMGMGFRAKESGLSKMTPQIRFGLTYHSISPLIGGMYSWEESPYDTLISTQTGQAYIIDSVEWRNAYMNQEGELLRVDASLIFRTNPEARWSLFAGIALGGGITFNNHTYLNYSVSRRTQLNYQGYPVTFFNPGQTDYRSESENYQQGANLFVTAAVPLGLDFRLGKEHDFWKRMHLYYEVKPGVNMVGVGELGNISIASLQQGIGLRMNVL